jgi:hypothetical protein
MSETRDTQTEQPATQRAEELLDRLGERVGQAAALARRSMERIAAGRADASMAERDDVPPPPAPATELSRSIGEQAGRFLALSGRRIRTAAALAQEEAEDMWAEAQHIRNENRRNPE